MTDTAVSVVDAHIHQWDPYTTPRVTSTAAKILRRAPILAPALRRMFPRPVRDFVGDPQYVLAPYLPADYRADGAPAGVGTVVHVEAGWHAKDPLGPAEETRWIARLPFGLGGAPALGAIVVHADPTQPTFGALLDAHLAASPLVRGVRCMAAHSDDPGIMDWNPAAHLYTDPAFLRGFAALAERDLSFDMWAYAHQLPDALVLAREYPDTTFVLDHYGTPAGAFGPAGRATGTDAATRRDIVARWRDDIAALAGLPNVVAKHSGLGMPVLGLGPVPYPQRRDAAAPLITHLQSSFGPERTFWSSNFPMDKPNISLAQSVSLLRDVLGDQFDESRILRDNARRVYRVAVP